MTTMRRHPLALALAAAFCLANAPQPAAAASRHVESAAVAAHNWASKRFVYKADNRRVVDVLQDFAASEGLPAVIGDGVEGVVQANFDATPEEFLNAMNKAYGVIWYHDGTALYFYPAKAIQSRMFRLKGFRRQEVENLLDSLHIGDKRYPLRFSPDNNTLLVYGPPRHIDLVAAALDTLDAGVTEHNKRVVRVFPLRFASAADRKFGNDTVPGLASMMNSVYGEKRTTADGKTSSDPLSAISQSNAGKMKALQAITGANIQSNVDSNRRSTEQTSPDSSTMGIARRGLNAPDAENADDSPSFEADESTNSIIVRGRVENMADYGELIRRLDRKPTLVEIEAMIIDVDNDSMNTLGIAWSASSRHAAVGVTPANTSAASTDLSTSSGTFSLTTLWSNAGNQLLSRIDALASEGKARVIAKPRVLGVANRAAVMEDKRVASVRVAGNLDASLFQVEAGTHLEVTPQITEYGDNARIKLSLFIQDGNFESNTVDAVPVVRHTQIVTEAHITEGESLLIGGITSDSETTTQNGVPGLQSIPVLGNLFKWKSHDKSHTERLFLLTPHVLRDATPDSVAGGSQGMVYTSPAAASATGAQGLASGGAPALAGSSNAYGSTRAGAASGWQH